MTQLEALSKSSWLQMPCQHSDTYFLVSQQKYFAESLTFIAMTGNTIDCNMSTHSREVQKYFGTERETRKSPD